MYVAFRYSTRIRLLTTSCLRADAGLSAVFTLFHHSRRFQKVPEGSRRLQEVSGTFHTIDARTQFCSPDLAQSAGFFLWRENERADVRQSLEAARWLSSPCGGPGEVGPGGGSPAASAGLAVRGAAMNPPCGRCGKAVYPTEKINCLDKVRPPDP